MIVDKVESCRARFPQFSAAGHRRAMVSSVLRTLTTLVYPAYRLQDYESREMESSAYPRVYRVGPSAFADEKENNNDRFMHIIDRKIIVFFFVFHPAISFLFSPS